MYSAYSLEKGDFDDHNSIFHLCNICNICALVNVISYKYVAEQQKILDSQNCGFLVHFLLPSIFIVQPNQISTAFLILGGKQIAKKTIIICFTFKIWPNQALNWMWFSFFHQKKKKKKKEKKNQMWFCTPCSVPCPTPAQSWPHESTTRLQDSWQRF